jgi:uncharacterized protein
LSKEKHLLDVNVLIALADKNHIHHALAQRWFDTPGIHWGLCAFTETGFLRVSTNPRFGSHTMLSATAVLDDLANLAGYSFWPVATSWATLTAPFRPRIFGHQQVTDAYLLGLTVQQGGILVTLDKAILYLAGPAYSKHVLLLN